MKRAGKEPYQLIEHDLITVWREKLWTPFINGVRKYHLVEEGDKIAVCISGGKDSMLLAKLMQELSLHGDVPFEAVYLVMDPGYNKINREKIESNAAYLHIPITVFESDVFEVANMQDKNPCYLCARMRRGCLYKKAKELGCNKIALGHHFDDVIVTTMMGLLWSAKLEAMIPMLESKNFPGIRLIRPMYMVHEDNIIEWRDMNKLSFIQCACRFTENCEIDIHASKRLETKLLIKHLRETNPCVETNIFNGIHNVELDTFPAWKTKKQEHSFLERFDVDLPDDIR